MRTGWRGGNLRGRCESCCKENVPLTQSLHWVSDLGPSCLKKKYPALGDSELSIPSGGCTTSCQRCWERFKYWVWKGLFILTLFNSEIASWTNFKLSWKGQVIDLRVWEEESVPWLGFNSWPWTLSYPWKNKGRYFSRGEELGGVWTRGSLPVVRLDLPEKPLVTMEPP